jgi:hypothetical protein
VISMSLLHSRIRSISVLAAIIAAGPFVAAAQESAAPDAQIAITRGESRTAQGDTFGSNWIVWVPGGGPARDVVAALGNEQHAVAWSAPDVRGRARIFLAESTAAAPLARALSAFDDTASGENREPSLAFAPGARSTSVVWVNRTENRQALFFYDPALGKSVVVAASADSSIETPTITWLDAETPAISWVEVSGSSSTVFAAWRFGEEWETRRASTEEHPYDLMPQFLSSPSPALWWYSFEGAGVDLRSAEVGLWGMAPRTTTLAHPAPANRLPLLFEGGSAELPAAAWMEALPNGEALLKYDPNRPIESAFSAASTDDEARPFDPAASGDALAWIEEVNGTRRVMILRADQGRESLPATASARQLRISVNSDSELIVWIDATTDGGTGSVHAAFHRIRPLAEVPGEVR